MSTHSTMDRAFGDHPIKWLYADAPTRAGASGFVATDVGRMAWQQDNDSFWVLKDTTPTWVAAGSGGGGSGDVVGPASALDNAVVRFDGTTGKIVQVSGIYIDDNGDLGIGTNNPDHELTMEGDGSSITAEMRNFSSNAGHAPRIQMVCGRGSPASKAAVVDGDTIGLWNLRAQYSGAGDSLAARITWRVEGTVGTAKVPTAVEWETSNDQGVVSEKMRLGPDYLWLKERVRLGRLAAAASVNSGVENIIGVTDTSAVRTVTILSADIAHEGRLFIVKDESGGAGTNNITIATEGAENIDGAATATINNNYGSLRMYSNGSHLFIF